jgi:hypothetical protein
MAGLATPHYPRSVALLALGLKVNLLPIFVDPSHYSTLVSLWSAW